MASYNRELAYIGAVIVVASALAYFAALAGAPKGIVLLACAAVGASGGVITAWMHRND